MPHKLNDSQPSALAPDYYLQHFWQVIDGVEKQYWDLLNFAEHRYLKTLRQLSPPALVLYVRLINRKGPYFRQNKLDYLAAEQLPMALAELVKAQLLNFVASEKPAPDCLHCFTQTELLQNLKDLLPPGLRKAELLVWLTEWPQYPNWLTNLLVQEPVLCLAAADPWPFLKFLYFGYLTENLSGFAVKALGHVVPETVTTAAFKPNFSARAEAETCYRIEGIYAEFRILRAARTATEVHHWWQGQQILRADLPLKAQAVFDRLIAKLGRLLEREKAIEMAIALYQTSPVAPARERLVRIYIKQNNRAAAQVLCDTMLAAPCHAEEAYAAQQLRNWLNGGKRLTQARILLNEGEAIQLTYDGTVEAAALVHFAGQGWQGMHSENWLWNALFGLLFWDIIYDPSYGTFHQPLQLAPTDLYEAKFYPSRQAAIQQRLNLVYDQRACLDLLQTHHINKQGIANPFIGWHAELFSVLEITVQQVTANALIAVMEHMAKDLRRLRRGFPDLFLWQEGRYRLVEVKSTNDQLSPQQYQWLTFLQAQQIPASIQRIDRLQDNASS